MKNDCVIHRHSIGQKEGVIFQQQKKRRRKKVGGGGGGGEGMYVFEKVCSTIDRILY